MVGESNETTTKNVQRIYLCLHMYCVSSI